MKVNEPKISLTLRTNKTLSDGSHPIMLRVSFNGMKEKSCGFSCDESHWDKKSEKVKKGFPNYKSINEELTRLKNDAINRMLRQKMDGKGFDIASIVAPQSPKSDEVDNVKVKTFSSLIGAYIKENNLGYRTHQSYMTIQNHLKEIFNDDVDKFNLNDYINFLFEKGCKDGTIRLYLSKLRALGFDVPKQINKRFKQGNRKSYVHYRSFSYIKEYILKKIDGENISDGTWEHWGMLFFYIMLLFQGLSPIDLINIKKSEILLKFIDGEAYYCFDGKRKKTGVKVNIRIKQNSDVVKIIGRLINEVEGDYLLPFHNGHRFRTVYLLQMHTKDFKEDISHINDIIFAHNVECKDTVPLIPNDITYYSARHSYATAVMLNGGSPMALASLLGRSVNTIGVYVKQLTEDNDLVDASNLVKF